MKFRTIYLPPFKAAVSKPDSNFDFSEDGILGKFDKYFSGLKPNPRDSFLPRDFLYFDAVNQGLVWMYALSDDLEDGGYDTIDFEGGYYITYTYKDGDNEANQVLYNEAIEYINSSNYLELDVRENHYPMGHIITPQEIIDLQGFAQMETYIPIKIKK